MAVDYDRVLRELAGRGVEFILIGGVAGILHGSAKLTYDIDVVYNREPENVRRLVEALRPFKPYLRGAPPGLPFSWSEDTIRMGLNFTLTTTLGDVDIIGEATGGGTYPRLLPHSAEVSAFGIRFLLRRARASHPAQARRRTTEGPRSGRRATGAPVGEAEVGPVSRQAFLPPPSSILPKSRRMPSRMVRGWGGQPGM